MLVRDARAKVSRVDKIYKFLRVRNGKAGKEYCLQCCGTLTVDRDSVADNYCSGSLLDDGTAIMILPASPIMIWA